jgi:UDP-N-acetylmuramate dehydrogenase
MTRRERAPLAPLTTFGVGGEARALIELDRSEELEGLLPLSGGFFILGGGSNVLAPDRALDALVIKVATRGLAFAKREGGKTRASIAAGEPWDGFVREAALRGLWGVENLAGIPGTAGGAAVQNIGAYGAELAGVFESAETYDLARGERRVLSAAECAFGYRESVFKRRPELLITKVAFLLSAAGAPDLSYADLALAEERGEPLSSPAEVGAAVRRIRAGKFPDLAVEGTAGSFFKNPIVPAALAAALAERYPGLPRYPQPGGAEKLSLAWLLDRALGLKGFAVGKARLFERQPLVIAAAPRARAREIEELARAVERRARESLGIDLEREVIHMAPHFLTQRYKEAR